MVPFWRTPGEPPQRKSYSPGFALAGLVGELSVLIKRRHPEVQAEIDRVYRERLAQLGQRRRDPARKTIDSPAAPATE
jgi:hypothetical protein